MLAILFVGALALTPSDAHALDSGQVLARIEPGPEAVHHVSAEGVVDAPPAKVWSVVTDFADYYQIYSGIKRSEVRARNGDTLIGYFLLAFPWPLPERWTLNDTVLDPDRMRFKWQRVGGTVRRYDGSLELLPWHQDETLMVFRAAMDPGLAFVPGWLVDYVSLNTLPAIVQGVRDFVARPAAGKAS